MKSISKAVKDANDLDKLVELTKLAEQQYSNSRVVKRQSDQDMEVSVPKKGNEQKRHKQFRKLKSKHRRSTAHKQESQPQYAESMENDTSFQDNIEIEF